MNGPAMASIAAVSPLQYLLMAGYDGVVIDDINLDITSMDRKTNAQLERISVNKAEVAPGDTVMLTAYLRTTSGEDRKSTRLNSSHLGISYAVFCLKKKTT